LFVNGIAFILILEVAWDSVDWVIWSQTGIKSGICEHGNETSRSILLVVVKMLSSILAGRFSKWLINHKLLTKFQAGFVKGNRTADSIFVSEIIAHKYLRNKTGYV